MIYKKRFSEAPKKRVKKVKDTRSDSEILSDNVISLLSKVKEKDYKEEYFQRMLSYFNKNYDKLTPEAKDSLDKFNYAMKKNLINKIKRNPVLLDAAKYVNIPDAYDKIASKYRNKDGFISGLNDFSQGGWFSGLTAFIDFVKNTPELKVRFEKDIFSKQSFKKYINECIKDIIKLQGKFLSDTKSENILRDLLSSGSFLIKSSIQKKITQMYKDIRELRKEDPDRFVSEILNILEFLQNNI